uniref:CdiA family toxin C-terminal domain-containing protein n=1 Tax=Snodgrassella gandavensis TaxID=2946698 RepID=UPI001EF60BE9
GESKLNAQERKINEKLKKAGVQNADDYQRKYDACKTEACRQQVKKDYIEATEQASKIILDLYRSGQLSTEESMILLTSYASKMMQGAGESQDGLSTPIFNMDAQKWTPSGVIANPDLQQITLSNLVQKMKQSGASEQQIAMRVLQYQIAGQAIGSYSMAEQVDALYNSGVSLNTVINAITLRRGKALSAKEIQSITSRYNNKAGSLVTANGQVIKNAEANAIKSESRGVGKEVGKEAAKAEKGTTTVKSTDGISFNIEQPKHLATVDGFSQKNGISGGHNADAFYSAVKQNGVKIVSETPTGTNGITNVRYQVPALDRAGNVIGYKAEVKTKTIYDPKIFTDQKMLDLGQQVAMKGYKEAMSSSKGIADATVNGITFRIYVDKTTGTVRNFHPK